MGKQLFPRMKRGVKVIQAARPKSVFSFYTRKVDETGLIYKGMFPCSGVIAGLKLFIEKLEPAKAVLSLDLIYGPGHTDYKIPVRLGMNMIEQEFDVVEGTRFSLYVKEEGLFIEEVLIGFTFSPHEQSAPLDVPSEEVHKTVIE